MTGPRSHDEPLDFPARISELAALQAPRTSAEWDALAAGILRVAQPELERRRGRRGFVYSLLRFARPVSVAAAAVLLCGAIALAFTSDAEATVANVAPPTFAEVVDREPASSLMAIDRPPSATDLERVVERDSIEQVQP